MSGVPHPGPLPEGEGEHPSPAGRRWREATDEGSPSQDRALHGNLKLSPWLRGITLASHLALIAAVALRGGWGLPLILVAPLLLPLPGLLRGRDYTYAWSTMLVVFYVGGYLAAGYATPADKWTCFGIAGLAAIDFVSLNLYVKSRARERALAGLPGQTARSGAASH
jgi:uncharacterized membrane protein